MESDSPAASPNGSSPPMALQPVPQLTAIPEAVAAGVAGNGAPSQEDGHGLGLAVAAEEEEQRRSTDDGSVDRVSAPEDRALPGTARVLRHLRVRFAPRRKTAAAAQGDLGVATIVVERDDSLPAIFGKLDAARQPRVILLVRRGNRELQSAVGARLLMRHADWAGKAIVLVTRRGSLRQTARAEGLRYVGSERRATFPNGQKRTARLGSLDMAVPALSTIAGLVGICLLVALAAIGALWYLPSATLTLFPPSTPVSQEQTFTIDSIADKVDLVNAVVPGSRRSISSSRTVVLPVTGSASVQQTSGDPRQTPAVAAADLQTAKNLATQALTDQAMRDLSNQYGNTWMFFPETAQVDQISVQPQQQVGASTTLLEVRYQGTVSMLGVQQSFLRQLMLSHLDTQVPAGKQLISSSVLLSVEKTGPFDAPDDRLPLQLRIDAATTTPVDENGIARALRGKSPPQALAYAEQATTGVRAPILTLSPRWAPRLPHATSRVRVDLAVAPSEK